VSTRGEKISRPNTSASQKCSDDGPECATEPPSHSSSRNEAGAKYATKNHAAAASPAR
jgi:hypothetical protein